MRLVHLVDRLLDLLEADPDYPSFLLDAQTVVLEDYLAIRPQNRERLERQLQAGRIEVGPWYVQPDESLVSGESLVRNFLLSRAVAERHHVPQGGLRVGYLPDMFGHIAQMPQFLRGFGIDNALLWRGISHLETQEFRWRSPDGSEVIVNHLPDRTGYSMLHHLSSDPVQALEQVRGLYADLDPYAHTPLRLLLVGSDHVEPQRGMPALLRAVAALPDAPEQLAQTGLGAFVNEWREYLVSRGLLGDGGLPVILGELRDTNRSPRGHMNFVLPNVLSARLPLKQRNSEVQRELVSWAEPLAAFAVAQGGSSSRDFLRQAWTYLLANHPHDSICGCSRDEVHRHMGSRFDAAQEIAAQVVREQATRLARAVDTSTLPGEGRAILLINPTAYARNEVVDVTVDLRRENWRDIEVRRPDGTAVPTQVVSRQGRLRAETVSDPPLFPILVTEPGAAPQPESGWFTAFESVDEVRLRFAADVPAMGYSTYLVVPQKAPAARDTMRCGALEATNGILRLRLDPIGNVSLEHLPSGQTWSHFLRLEDGGDGGDGYTFSPPPEDRVFTWRPESVSLIEDGPLATTFRLAGDFLLPTRLGDGRRRRSEALVACPISIDLTLSQGAPLVDVQVHITNWAMDHRLRLVVSSGIPCDAARAESQWAIVSRSTRPEPPDRAVWIEDAPRCHPTHGFVEVPGGPGFAVLGFGLPEYEVGPEGEIGITLLRAFGHLGSPDPTTIRAGAGPGFPTPDAQLLGQTLNLHLALVPHSAAHDIWRLSKTWQTPCRAFPQSRHPGKAPLSARWLVVPDGADVSAVKEAEDGDGVVVRVLNPSDRTIDGTVHLAAGGEPVRVSLDETPLHEGKPDPLVHVRPWELLTLRVPLGGDRHV